MSTITPDSPLASVFGRSTKKRDAVINGLGLETVGDLLAHFPRRYVKTSELSDMDEPAEGQIVSVVGEVTSSEVKSFKNRRTNKLSYRVEVRIKTNAAGFTMSFFVPWKGQAETEQRRMARGNRGMFTGKAQRFNQTWQIASPHSVMFTGDGDDDGLAASLKGLLPIYPVTATVYSWDVQKAVQSALDLVSDVPDVFPEELREQFSLLDVSTALRWIHAPDDYRQVGAAQKRFRFEEALVTQLVLARRRRELREQGGQARTGDRGDLLPAFDARLPFELTNGQREIGEVIEEELARPHPMNRLLQGEVGSGKTLVAVRAMLRTVDSGGQAALLAPTEVLAQQHHRSITEMLGDLAGGGMLGGAAEATSVALLTGLHDQGPAPGVHASDRQRRGGHRDRHPRPAGGERHLRRPRPGRRRRAAPLRRRAARGPHRQGRDAAPRPGHDRHPHPADGRHDRLRRPGDLDARGAARRPRPHPDQRRPPGRPAALDRPGLGAGPRGGRQGAPGLRRLPTDHRRRAGGG